MSSEQQDDQNCFTSLIDIVIVATGSISGLLGEILIVANWFITLYELASTGIFSANGKVLVTLIVILSCLAFSVVIMKRYLDVMYVIDKKGKWEKLIRENKNPCEPCRDEDVCRPTDLLCRPVFASFFHLAVFDVILVIIDFFTGEEKMSLALLLKLYGCVTDIYEIYQILTTDAVDDNNHRSHDGMEEVPTSPSEDVRV